MWARPDLSFPLYLLGPEPAVRKRTSEASALHICGTASYPVPPPKATPRSLLFRGVPCSTEQAKTAPAWRFTTWDEDPQYDLRTFRPVSLPRDAPVILFTTSQARHQQRMEACTSRFWQCLQRTASSSILYHELQRSEAPNAHVSQLLAGFAPGTLERYLSCIASFLDLHLSEGLSSQEISPALMADYLYAAQRSMTHDRGMHRTSPTMCIKALRWWAKHCSWQELAEVLQTSLVAAYSRRTAIQDKRESVPVPMAVLASWERTVCSEGCSQSVRLFLSTALLCCHASIRFGDIQRVRWSSLQLSTAGLHGICTATKTTRHGQPFACTWHGITGREFSSSWLLHWLAELASLSEPHSQCKAPAAEPDFLFLNCSLRWAMQSTAIMGQEALAPYEARELTLHSMKTTMLAAAAQLVISREERLAQGHHRDSAKLYSRNDTYDSLRVQRRLALQLAQGWRPNRSMARGGSAPTPEPPFSVSSTAPLEFLKPMDLKGGLWARFTSRHESLHASLPAPSSDPSPTIAADSDSEAEAVQAYAALHGSSDEELGPASTAEQPLKVFVCNGPWSSCHLPTETSEAEYMQSTPRQPDLLRAAEPSLALQPPHCWLLTQLTAAVAKDASEEKGQAALVFSCLFFCVQLWPFEALLASGAQLCPCLRKAKLCICLSHPS